MAPPTFPKAALHHARGHNKWVSDESDTLDTTESFDFGDTPAFMALTPTRVTTQPFPYRTVLIGAGL